jgi:hypothetical protein
VSGDVRTLVAGVVVLSLVSCGTANTTLTPSSGTILPNTKLVVSPSVSYTAEQLAVAALVGGVLYKIYDPLAPNWNIEEKALDVDTYYLSLRAKSFRTGGDGEGIQIVKRRALQLQREKGYAAYRILDYTEGVESSTPLTHRVSEGTIQLVRTLLPPTP